MMADILESAVPVAHLAFWFVLVPWALEAWFMKYA
jgi:hypothetical protein